MNCVLWLSLQPVWSIWRVYELCSLAQSSTSVIYLEGVWIVFFGSVINQCDLPGGYMNYVIWFSHQPVWSTRMVYELCSLAKSSTSVIYLEGIWIMFFGSVINQCDLPGGYMNCVLWLSLQPVWSIWKVYELCSLVQSSTSVIYLEGIWIVFFGSVFNQCDLPWGYMNCVLWLRLQPVWSTRRVYELCSLAQSSTSVIYLEGIWIMFFGSVINQCDLPGGYMNCVICLCHQPVWSTWRVYELCYLIQSLTSVIYPDGIWIVFFGSVFNQCDLPGGYMNCVLWLSLQQVWSTWRVYELCSLAQSSTSVIYLEGIWIVFFGSVINQCDLPGGYMNCVLWLSLQPVWSTWRVHELCSLVQSSTSVIYLEGIWIVFFGSVFNQCDLSEGFINCVIWLSHQPVWSTWRVYELCSLAQSSTSLIYLEGIWIVFFGSVINQCYQPGRYMNCVLWLSHQPVWSTWRVYELCSLAQSSTSVINLEGTWIVLFGSVINQCDLPGGFMNCVIWFSHQPVWSTWRVYELCYLAQSSTSVIYLEGIWIAFFCSRFNQCDLPGGYMNCVLWLSLQPVWSIWRVYELRSLVQTSTSVIYLEGIWIAFFGSVFNQCDLSWGYMNCVLWLSLQPVWSTWRVHELCYLAQSSTSVIYMEGIWIAFFGSGFNQCDLPGGYMNCVLWLSLQPVWSTRRVYELGSLAQSSISLIYLEGTWIVLFGSVINPCDLPGGYMNSVIWFSHQTVWSTRMVYELCSLAQSSTSLIYLEGVWILFFRSVINQCDLPGGYMNCVLWLSLQPVWSTWRVHELRALAQSSTSVIYLEGIRIMFFGSVINQCDLPGGYMNCVLWLSLQPVWSIWRVHELCYLAQSSTSVIFLEGIWIVLFGSVFNQFDLPGGYMNCVLWLSHQPVWSTWTVYELCSLAQSSTSVIYLEGIWIVFFGSVINQCDQPGGYMNCAIWLSHQPVWSTWRVYELCYLVQSSTSVIYMEGLWIMLFGSVINQCDLPGGYMNCILWLSLQPVWSTWRVHQLCYLAQSSTSVIYLEGIWIAFFDSVINQCDLLGWYMNCVLWLSLQPMWSTWSVYELCSLGQSSTSVIYLEGIWIAFFGSVFNQCDLSGGYMNCVLWLSHQPVWSTWRVHELCSLAQSSTSVIYPEGIWIGFFGSVINQFDLPGRYMNCVIWLSHQPVWSTWRVYELCSLVQSSTSVIYLEGLWIVFFGSVINQCDLLGGYMNCVLWLSHQPVWSTWRVYELRSLAQSSTSLIYLEGIWIVLFRSVFNQCDLPGGYMNCALWLNHQPVWSTWRVHELCSLAQSSTSVIYLEGIWIVFFGSVIKQFDLPGGYINCVIWLSHQPVWSTWWVYEFRSLDQSSTSVIYLEGIWIMFFGSVINQCDITGGYMNCVLWLSLQPVWSTWTVYELCSLAQSSTSVIYLEGIWIVFFGSVINQCDLPGGCMNCVLWLSHQPVWSTWRLYELCYLIQSSTSVIYPDGIWIVFFG